MRKIDGIVALLFLAGPLMAQAQDTKAQVKPKVRYTKGKKLDFESLLIEGQLKRPEISVVTGNAGVTGRRTFKA